MFSQKINITKSLCNKKSIKTNEVLLLRGQKICFRMKLTIPCSIKLSQKYDYGGANKGIASTKKDMNKM